MTASAKFITDERLLPADDLAGLWEGIIVDGDAKERLMNHALLSLRVRSQVPFSKSALHGLILVLGSPGTGKTTLARALGHEISPLVSGEAVRLIEIDPHGLMSAEHGQSQQRVTELLCDEVPLRADDGVPTIVLLDEVESMAVARSEASLSANPADVHRATDAVLMALDRNADRHSNLLTVATSNFPEALDEAFKSRADAAIAVPLPSEAAIEAILRVTLNGFTAAFPELEALAASQELKSVASQLRGRDGRQVRKLVIDAMASRRETVLDPGSLTIMDLAAAARRTQIPARVESDRAAA